MYTKYISAPDTYVQYYLDQVGGNQNPGYYRGRRVQRGFGLGRLFSKMFRFAMPLFKRGAAHVGKALGRTGANILADAAAGTDIKDSAKTHLKNMGQQLVGDAAGYVLDQVNNQSADSTQSGGRVDVSPLTAARGCKRKCTTTNDQSTPSSKREKVDFLEFSKP